MIGKNVKLDVEEVKKPELSAPLVADHIAVQLEGRVAFRRAMKKAIADRDAHGRQGHQDPLRRAPGRRRDGPRRDLRTTAACPCIPCAPTSTTAWPRPARPVRRHRREGLDLQGRDLPGRVQGTAAQAGGPSSGPSRSDGQGFKAVGLSSNGRRDPADTAEPAGGSRTKRTRIMLMPKRTKFRKTMKGKRRGKLPIAAPTHRLRRLRSAGRRGRAGSPVVRSRPRVSPSPAA